MNGLGIVASDLVSPGMNTVMLHGSEVRIGIFLERSIVKGLTAGSVKW
jgi:hypothetical protein